MDIHSFLSILFFCVIGSAYTSYKIGLREGAEGMIEFLDEVGIIHVDEKGNITSSSK